VLEVEQLYTIDTAQLRKKWTVRENQNTSVVCRLETI